MAAGNEDKTGAAKSAAERERMVVRQLEQRDIRDPVILRAMRAVPRELFVPEEFRSYAYDDSPLPIPAHQTISQPYVVAYMIEALALQPTDRVLEVGSGSGYAAAILSLIVSEVFGVERHAELVQYARERLERGGYHNVTLRHGDGTRGWPEHAPYDGIIVAAGGPAVPPSLRGQLAIGGRLVMPVGRSRHQQHLILLTRRVKESFDETRLAPVAFVPLIGQEGWEGRETN